MPSSNFKNPMGLLGRMLASFDRVAYSALAHEAMRHAARPVDFLLRRKERRWLEQHNDNGKPLILIVGPPRSGTTLVYQVMARYLDVSYYTNLSSLFPRSPIEGTRRFRRLQRGKADFQNFYGQTARLSGPNDAFQLWNRWLGDDRYLPATELSESACDEMRCFFDTWTSVFGKPFLNKNNRNTSCMHLLSQVLPSAYFVVVRRAPQFAAQSLIKARERVQGDKNIGWGLQAKPESSQEEPLGYVDDVCEQLKAIELDLATQVHQIDACRVFEVNYETFCEAPEVVLRHVAAGIPDTTLHQNRITQELKPFTVSSGPTIAPEEQERIRSHFAEQGSRVS